MAPTKTLEEREQENRFQNVGFVFIVMTTVVTRKAIFQAAQKSRVALGTCRCYEWGTVRTIDIDAQSVRWRRCDCLTGKEGKVEMIVGIDKSGKDQHPVRVQFGIRFVVWKGGQVNELGRTEYQVEFGGVMRTPCDTGTGEQHELSGSIGDFCGASQLWVSWRNQRPPTLALSPKALGEGKKMWGLDPGSVSLHNILPLTGKGRNVIEVKVGGALRAAIARLGETDILLLGAIKEILTGECRLYRVAARRATPALRLQFRH